MVLGGPTSTSQLALIGALAGTHSGELEIGTESVRLGSVSPDLQVGQGLQGLRGRSRPEADSARSVLLCREPPEVGPFLRLAPSICNESSLFKTKAIIPWEMWKGGL